MPTASRAVCERFDALIFDLFGVVISFDDGLVTGRLAKYCTDPARAFIAMKDIVSDGELIRGKLSLSGLYARLVRDHGLSLDMTAFESLWREPYSKSMPGMRELLQGLAGRQKIVLLSNVDEHYWRVIQSLHDELRYFDQFVLSWELGRAKPEQEVFARAAEAARTEPHRCFFVDDKIENTRAAALLGMHTHLFAGVGTLREALSRERII